MSNHTPGPWTARPVPNVGLRGHTGYAIDFNEDQEQVVDFVYEEADARLIAAAPELLAALEAAVECGMVPSSTAKDGGASRHARQIVVADMIREAIAKARVKP